MSRPNKMHWRPYPKGGGAWVTKVDGHLHTLASGAKDATRAEARKAFHRLMVTRETTGSPPPEISVVALAELFLDECQTRLAPLTYEWYRRHLQSFAEEYGRAKAAEIRPLHVTRWLARHRWSEGTKHGAITAVKRLYSWAKRQGYFSENPLEGLERPGIPRRTAVFAEGQGQTILNAIPDREFRDLLFFLSETGARPSEAARVEAAMIDFTRCFAALPGKTTRHTGKPRLIQLNHAAIALCQDLAVIHPEGPLFRNRRGRAWTRNAMACRFARLRKRLGMGPEATAESYRHAYATDGLEIGVTLKTVSELLGHQSTAMVERHYSHLHERLDHLKEAAEKIRPPSSASGDA